MDAGIHGREKHIQTPGTRRKSLIMESLIEFCQNWPLGIAQSHQGIGQQEGAADMCPAGRDDLQYGPHHLQGPSASAYHPSNQKAMALGKTFLEFLY